MWKQGSDTHPEKLHFRTGPLFSCLPSFPRQIPMGINSPAPCLKQAASSDCCPLTRATYILDLNGVFSLDSAAQA